MRWCTRMRRTPPRARARSVAGGALIACAVASVMTAAPEAVRASEPVATYSIVGYDPETGDLGVAVQSKFFAVGSVVPWAKAGIGAIASQAYGNTTFGPRGLALLEEGVPVQDVIARLIADDADREQRQIGVVDARGVSAAYTGSKCMAWAGHESGPYFSAQGNILVSEATVKAMAEAFRATDGVLGERLMRAIEAGQAAGGDSRGMQSAAILIVRAKGGYGGYNDRYCDLRVDDHPNPVAELRRIFDMWKGEALIYEGYRLCDEALWEEAFTRGREAVAMAPDRGEPRYHLACYYSRAGRWEMALAELADAVALDPSLKPRASEDPDFEPLRADPRFLAITK
jgi:uncharacterized Ntn-hydrolase superfamily protein